MKYFLIAAFVALCTASTVYRGRNVSVSDDGTINISSPSGKRVVITRQLGYNGQRNIDIAISGPNMPTKRIQIDDNTNNLYDVETEGNTPWSSANSVGEEFRLKRSSKKSQGDVLVDICKDYQGTIDQPLFEKLLNRIRAAVEQGQINRQIYQLLLELDQIGEGGILGYQQGYPQEYQQDVYYNGQRGQGLVNSYIPRVLVGGQYGEQYPVTQGLYRYGGVQNWGTTRFVNPLLEAVYQQRIVDDLLRQQQLYGGLYQGGVLSENYPIRGNVLLKEYLMNQQQTPVAALWRSMAYQPLLKEGRLGGQQYLYGLGYQQPIYQGQQLPVYQGQQQRIYQGQQQPIYQSQQGSIAQFLNALRRQQGILSYDSMIQQQQQQPIVQTFGGLTQQQRQPVVIESLDTLAQEQPVVVQTLRGLTQQEQPILVQTLGGLTQQQQQPLVGRIGGYAQQQRQVQPVMQTLGGLIQQQRQPIVVQTLAGLPQQQRQPILIQDQQVVPQVVY